jgi:hypothetical protein
MGGEGFEPPTTWPPANLIQFIKNKLRYHTKLDHPPFIGNAKQKDLKHKDW